MEFGEQRKELVKRLKKKSVIKTLSVERALLKVKREDFMTQEYRDVAYEDTPLPIPPGYVFISAPHMHATYLSAAMLKKGNKVLEIGAGSGILLAYIREIVGKEGLVVGTEIIPETFEFAKKNLEKSGYKNIVLLNVDGSKGVEKFAPYNVIISSASVVGEIPKIWIEQLKLNGILITPMGRQNEDQELFWFKKTKKGLEKKHLGGVVFVELQEK